MSLLKQKLNAILIGLEQEFDKFEKQELKNLVKKFEEEIKKEVLNDIEN